jgi:hypothetical protein
MLQFRGFHDYLILLLTSACTLLFALEPASAQMSTQEKQRIATMIAAEINRAITTHQPEGIALREKVVGRLVQCGGLFVMMSKHVPDTEASKRVGDVAAISYELSTLVSDGIAVDRFKEIAEAAQKVMNDKLAAKRTPESEREMNMVVRNCRSFHSLAEVPDAVAELLTASAHRDEPSIQFAKELQECSLYYLLLAGGLITEVPNKSGRLSPVDKDKAVKGMVYQTKSEQIEVLYKRLAHLAGMTQEALTARRDTMFENQKLLMGREWNMSGLHERYEAFCEYLLSDTGGKARLQDITRGNVCGGLYKCW